MLPWGNISEKQRAQRIKSNCKFPEKITILAKMTINEIAQQLSQVKAVVAVDTGLAHLAAALDKPLISLFGPTNPILTRPYASNKSSQRYLQVDYPCKACMKKQCTKFEKIDENNSIKPACYSSLTPKVVAQSITTLLFRINH
jgi:heptosyltransferase-1